MIRIIDLAGAGRLVVVIGCAGLTQIAMDATYILGICGNRLASMVLKIATFVHRQKGHSFTSLTSFKKKIRQSVTQFIDLVVNQSINQSIRNQSINQSVNKSVSLSCSQSCTQLACSQLINIHNS